MFRSDSAAVRRRVRGVDPGGRGESLVCWYQLLEMGEEISFALMLS